MSHRTSVAGRLLGACGLVLSLSLPVVAQNVYPEKPVTYRSDRISTMGRVSIVERQGDRYRVRLEHGDYDYFVPVATVGTRNLTVGGDVRIAGIVAGNLVNVDLVALPGETYYASDPNYVAVPYPSRGGWMTGVVQRVNRHLGYLDLQEDGSGAIVKIDVRHMDVRKPFNVWNIRTGERISVNGVWERRGNFDARRIEY